MKKYLVIDNCKSDIFEDAFETEEEALKAAKDDWDRLTRAEKKRRVAFYVLETVNPDPDAVNHHDGTVLWQAK